MGYFSDLDIEKKETKVENIKLNFKTVNVNINGTCLQGYIEASYHDLVQVFGPSNDGDGYKTDAEWAIRFEDNSVATIYNWKNGHNYCDEDGLSLDEITEWHIGGHDDHAVNNVHYAFNAVIN